MQQTGERYLPELDGDVISYEHWHRYQFATQFVAGKAVLDIASGEGFGSALLAASAASVVGVDRDPTAVAHAREKYPDDRLTFVEGEAEAIPFPDHHLFDVVVSFETIEHLHADAQRRFLGEVKRLLKPDGLVLISTPNRDLYSRDVPHNPFHLSEFSPPEYAGFLGSAFQHVRVLNQRVYTGSYLWGGDASRRFAEYQLEFSDGQYRPSRTDRKVPMYLIALCSDHALPTLADSLLVDASTAAGDDSCGHVSALFIDAGAGFTAADRRCQRLPAGPGRFRVGFAVGRAVRGLRWDPLELRTCRVRVDRVEWEDAGGRVHPVDPAALATNGAAAGGGVVAFDTLDPVVLLPVAGDVARVTIEGWYEADDLPTSLARATAAATDRRREPIPPANGQAEGTESDSRPSS